MLHCVPPPFHPTLLMNYKWKQHWNLAINWLQKYKIINIFQLDWIFTEFTFSILTFKLGELWENQKVWKSEKLIFQKNVINT